MTAAARTWDHPVPPPAGSGTEPMMARATERETSASRISVPLQMFLAAAGTIVVMTGAFYQATGSIRSSMDVMLAKIDGAAETAKLRDDFTKAQLEGMRDEQKSQRGKQDLLQLQLQQVQLELAAIKAKR